MGLTRAAASSVPSTRASSPASADRLSVVRNAVTSRSTLSNRNCTPHLPAGTSGGRRREQGPRRRPGGSVAVDRRGLGSLLAGDLPGRAVPGVCPRPVLERRLEGVVDEGAEVVVALLQADAVGLLGEGVADQL